MAEKICRRCDEPFMDPSGGDVYCAICKPIARAMRVERRRALRAAPLCKCGAEKIPNEIQCQDCKRERVAARMREYRSRNVVHGAKFPPRLPVGPLYAKVKGLVDRNAEITEHGCKKAEPVLERVGVNTKRYYEWSSGKVIVVSIALADRVLTLAGWDWLDVWDRESCPELVDALEAIDRLGEAEPDGYCPVCEEHVASINGRCPWHEDKVRVEQCEAVAA